MKNQLPKFSIGSLFICTKCGKDFNDSDFAEKLKSDLRATLKNDNKDHLKVRVMVSSCLGVCIKGEQAFGYYPNEGKIELYATSPKESEDQILDLISVKIS